jgi:hypothetical protein
MLQRQIRFFNASNWQPALVGVAIATDYRNDLLWMQRNLIESNYSAPSG